MARKGGGIARKGLGIGPKRALESPVRAFESPERALSTMGREGAPYRMDTPPNVKPLHVSNVDMASESTFEKGTAAKMFRKTERHLTFYQIKGMDRDNTKTVVQLTAKQMPEPAALESAAHILHRGANNGFTKSELLDLKAKLCLAWEDKGGQGVEPNALFGDILGSK